MPSFMPAFMDAAALLIASPSKTCRVRVSSTRYRNDPYRARVLPRLSPMSPVVARQQQPRYYVPAIIVPTVTAAGATATNFAAIVAKSPEAPLRRTATQTPAAAAVPRATTFAAAAAAAAVPEPVTLVPTKPTLGSSSTVAAKPQEHFALVGFKHETSMYVAPFRVSVGDVVIVEADRGEHIGVVQSITTQKPAYNVPNRVVRRASATEVATIDELTFKEAKTTAAVQKQSESLGLGIRVVDVEFQMDLNKLTVFFASKCFVDFRKLQRALFREYRCRIWLVNWDEVRTYSPVPVNPAQA